MEPLPRPPHEIELYGSGPMTRYNFIDEHGARIGVSVRANSTPEDLEKVRNEISRVTAKIISFKALPIEDQLGHYLHEAYNTFKDIMDYDDETVVEYLHDRNLNTVPELKELVKRLENRIRTITGKADMACCTIPSQYGHTYKTKATF